MKKILFTLIVALGAISCAAAIRPVRINTLVNEYKGTEGFDVVRIGPVGMGFLKLAATFSSDLDKEALTLLSSVKGLNGITIVDFEDASCKKDFSRKIEKALEGAELFLEAKDGSETTISMEKIEKWNPKTGKCPKCSEDMKATGVCLCVD